jgi:ketosteroid isomerase-like protein
MTDVAVLNALNADIWHPFQEAYADHDAKRFLALYSTDLIRAGGPTKEVIDYDMFAAQMTQWFSDTTERGAYLNIEFRFSERLASAVLASERGVFRITASKDDDRRVFYGRFHTLARHVDGRWLLVADYDSDEGGTISDEAFAACVAIDDVSPFIN